MSELKLKTDYDARQIDWDDIIVPMKQKGVVVDPQTTNSIYELSKESSILKMSEDRHNEIIKAMYGKLTSKTMSNH